MKRLKMDAIHLSLLIVMSFFSCSFLYAQEVKRVVVEGVVVDHSGAGVPFAKIKITPITGDSTQYYTQVSDQLGAFRISLATSGEYRVHVTMVGMEDFEEAFTIPAGKKGYSLGKLVMEESATVLEDVTVTATKKLVKIEADKISYDIKGDPDSRSSDLLKMLRKVPLVTVDGQGNIQVNGSSNFKIYQNGKEDKMLSNNPKDILKSIPASSIKSIEVITDAGVKFDAESSGAILNIITEKNSNLSGIAGTIRGEVGSYRNRTASLNLTAKAGKVGFSGHVMYGLFGGKPSLAQSTTTLGALSIKNEGESVYKGNFSMFNGTISYELDSLNLLSLSARGFPYTSSSESSQLEQKWNNGKHIEKVNNSTSSKENSGSYSVNLDYQRSTKRRGELFTVSYMFDRSPNNSESDLIRSLLNLDSDEPIADGFSEQLSRTTSGMNEHSAQIDYTRPFQWQKRHNMESGIKFIARRSLSTPEYFIRNSSDEEFRKGSIFGQHINSSELNYGQDIYAFYMSWTTFWNTKISTKMGTRLEQSRLNVKYKELPEANFIRNAFDFVPQLQFNYNVTPFDKLTLNYNFRIRRPGISQVNPYRKQTSQHRVSYGNPDLQAERNHRLGVSLGHFSSKFTINSSIDYNFSNNAILQYSQEDAATPGIIHETYGNLGKSGGFSINLFANFSPWTWLRLYMNGNLSKYRLTSTVLEDKQNRSTIFAFGGGTFTLPKSWNISFSVGGYKFATYQMSSNFAYFSNVDVSKSLLNDKLTLSLNLIEPFRNKIVHRSHMFGKGFETHSVNTDTGARMISFSASYRFGELKERIKSVSRTISNTDLMEGDSGNKAPTGK